MVAVAYPEQHGKGWRVRWKNAPGAEPEWPSKSGFPTKRAAKHYGEEQEAKIRAGTWIDPALGEKPLEEFRAEWRAAQDYAPKTLVCYDQVWTKHIASRWGKLGLRHIPPLEMQTWLKGLAERYSASQVGTITSELNGIFDTAVYLDYITRSPMPPKQKKGARKRAARRMKPVREGIVATPAEIEEILRRMPTWADVLMVLIKATTGMRWSELIGMSRSHLTLELGNEDAGVAPSGHYVIDPQLGAVHEDRASQRYLGPPKSGASSRLERGYQPGRVVDLAPFQVLLLDAFLRLLPAAQESLFLNTNGDPWGGSSWRTSRWRPACDGKHAAHNRYGQVIREAWEPVHPGLIPHDMKHTHKALLNDKRVHPVMQDYRLGHIPPGTPGVYSHPTPQMRAECVAAVQETWLEWGFDLCYWGVAAGEYGVDMSGLTVPLTAVR